MPVIEIACDESGAEGEKLANGETRLFTHAGVAVDMADAVDCVAELRVRIGSPARTYKANHLLREKHRRALEWFLGPDGPIRGRARVVLVDKERFLLGTFLGLLANPGAPGWLAAPTSGAATNAMPDASRRSSADSTRVATPVAPMATDSTSRTTDTTSGTIDMPGGTADSMRGAPDPTVLVAHSLFPHTDSTVLAPNSTISDVDSTHPVADSTIPHPDSAVLDAVNELLRGRLGHDEFRRQVPAWPGEHDDAVRAIAARQARRNPDRVVLDPLFWAIARVADVWGEPVAVVHDRHLSLTPSRVAALVAVGGLARFDIASASWDARVQLADFLAGIVRRTCTAALAGDSDPALLDLVRPYLAISV